MMSSHDIDAATPFPSRLLNRNRSPAGGGLRAVRAARSVQPDGDFRPVTHRSVDGKAGIADDLREVLVPIAWSTMEGNDPGESYGLFSPCGLVLILSANVGWAYAIRF